MIPWGLCLSSPAGTATPALLPVFLLNLASMLLSKYKLIVDICAMKVKEVAKKRVRSKTDGIGEGSRRGTENEVHKYDSGLKLVGIEPHLAKS
jgi:hypothetical protein